VVLALVRAGGAPTGTLGGPGVFFFFFAIEMMVFNDNIHLIHLMFFFKYLMIFDGKTSDSSDDFSFDI